MGTQFRSRLSMGDRKRILEGIENAISSIVPTMKLPKVGRAKIEPLKVVPSIGSLSHNQVEQLGNATVRQVFTVAYDRGFFKTFASSTVFEVLLRWLKELHNDAVNNGFQGIINKYALDQSRNPVAVLNVEMEKIARKNMLDQHRVSASSAAKTVLAAIMILSGAPRSSLSDARAYGKALATFRLKDIVNRYIYSFVHGFISSIVSIANPTGKELIQDVVAEYTKGIADDAVKQIEKEKNLCNVQRTHEIVNTGLIRFSESAKA